MQYHKAAQIGKDRAQKAQMKLFNYAGFAMLTYTIKQGKEGFEPVGEEDLVGRMTRGREAMLFICDREGYAKAQSKAMPIDKGDEIFKKMISDGVEQFVGKIITVS